MKKFLHDGEILTVVMTARVGGSGEEEGGEACDIIIDDITYLTDPLFRDGILSQAVDEAVKKAGALYFASAGNYGNGYKFKSVSFSAMQVIPDVNRTHSGILFLRLG